MHLPIPYFRIIGSLEALSFTLTGNSHAVKYIWQKPEMVQYVGMIHGILFIAYVLAAFVLYKQLSWNKNFSYCIIMFFTTVWAILC